MTTIQSWASTTFAAAALPEFRRLLYALTTMFFALWMVGLARGFIVYELTASNAALGGVFVAFGVPQLVFGLFGGVVADRFPRRTLVMIGQTWFGVEYVGLGVLLSLGLLEYWMVIVASAIEGASLSFYIPARTALIGDLVPARSLGNAMALQQVAFNSSRVVGPLLAGWLIALPAVGSGGALILAGTMFIASAFVVRGLPSHPSKGTRPTGSPLSQITGGIAYLRGRPALVILVLTSYAVVTLAFPYIAFLPALVKDAYGMGSVALGALNATVAVGALMAAVLCAMVIDGASAWRWQAAASLGFVVVLMAFALAPSFPVALLIGALLGAGEIGFVSLNQGLAMRFADPSYHGRVQSLLMVGFALFGIMALPMGLLADAIGVRQTLFLQGAVGTSLLALIYVYARTSKAADDARLPAPAGVPVEVAR
ncbi:MAG: MFS transporter [Dehalococcoidia bacterium]|nr:MFS transporter [Dehalococcoidia bacterium]